MRHRDSDTNILGINPESFDPIDMVLPSAAARKYFEWLNGMLFTIPFLGLMPSKDIGVIDQTFARLGLDMQHEFLCTDGLHHFGIHVLSPLQIDHVPIVVQIDVFVFNRAP